MAEDGPDEGDGEPGDDPTEVRVQWTVPAPTPEGEQPASPWGRPGEEGPPDDGGASPGDAGPPAGSGDPSSPVPAPPPRATATTPAPTPGAPPSAADRRRTALVVTVVAVAAVAALVAGALVVVLATRDDEDGAAATTSTTATTEATTTAPQGLSGEVDIGAGITALVPEGALTEDAALEAEPLPVPDDVGGLVTPVGEVVRITLLRGEQLAPIGLRFPFSPPADLVTVDGTVPSGAVFALHREDGDWVPLPVVVDPDQVTATFETPSLSPFGIFTWSTPALQSAAQGVLAGLAGEAGEAAADLAPSCTAQAPEVEAPAVVDTGEGDALAWCAEEGTSGPQLKVANVSPHAVSVRWSEGVEAQVDEPTALGGQLTDVETATGDRVVVLGPGGRVTFLLPAGGATLTASYDGSAHAVTGLLAASRLLDEASPDVPWRSDVSAEQAEAAIAESGCASRLVPDMAVAAGVWRAALGSCLTDELLSGLVPEGAVAPMAALLRQLAEPLGGDHAALVDELRADSEVELVVPPS